MSLDPLDPEEAEDGCDHDFCPTLNGLGPHNYQPVLDPFGGTGLWMYCNQCGDTFNVDGTATSAASGSLSAPTSHPGSLGPLSSPTPKPSTSFP